MPGLTAYFSRSVTPSSASTSSSMKKLPVQLRASRVRMACAADITGMTFNYGASTQFGSEFAVNELTQDGFTAGRLSGVEVDGSGVVFARFTNGRSEPLGKIALGTVYLCKTGSGW